MRTVTLELPDDVARLVEDLSVAELSRIVLADREAKIEAVEAAFARLREVAPPMTREEADRFFEESYELAR